MCMLHATPVSLEVCDWRQRCRLALSFWEVEFSCKVASRLNLFQTDRTNCCSCLGEMKIAGYCRFSHVPTFSSNNVPGPNLQLLHQRWNSKLFSPSAVQTHFWISMPQSASNFAQRLRRCQVGGLLNLLRLFEFVWYGLSWLSNWQHFRLC